MVSRRGVLLGMAGAALSAPAWADAPLLRGADLRGDVAVLRDAYEALHPGLYRYNSRAQMAVRFDALAQAFSRDQTASEAYLTLSRFLATIRCGHTYANFYNQRRAAREALFDPLPRLPFHFAWLDERMIVVSNFSGDARLSPGAEILSIDSRACRRILHDLMPYARADGGNDAKRRAQLEVRGYDNYESFDIFYGLAYLPRSSFMLRVRPLHGHAQTLDVAALDLTARRSEMAGETASATLNWTLAYPDARTALLTMPTWAAYGSSFDWRGYLDSGFAEISSRGVTKLIVDLRGNEGGNDCGDEIIARLTDAPLARELVERRVRYRQAPQHLNTYLDTWDDSFRNWGDDATPIGNGWYRLRGETEDDRILPKGPRFRGETIVLIDAQNSSATFQFAHCIQTNRLGRLIGQPSGGNKRGINGGAFFFLRLPASGLEADLPLIGRFPLTPQPDAGLTPDLHVALMPEDIAAGRDAVMQAALRA